MFQQVKDLALSTAVVQVVAVVWVRSPAQEFLHAVGEVKKKKKKSLQTSFFVLGVFWGCFLVRGCFLSCTWGMPVPGLAVKSMPQQ